jgi:glycosyltransferase involved in cell wall biosynthesis
MSKSTLLSIVVPIYNIESFVAECAESLINQTYHNLEIILVNDGSTDNSGQICDHYAKKDDRIKVIHKPNGGLISARKTGLKMSSGEYVGYVDGDDWVEPEMYENLIGQAILHQADVVVAGHKENLAGRIEILHNQIEKGVYKGGDLEEKVFSRMLYSGKFSQFGIFSYVWGKLYKRSVLYPNQMSVDESIFIGEDAACLYPTLLDSQTIVVLDSAHYHYRQRVDSLIKTPKKTEVNKISTFYNYLKKQFVSRGFESIMLSQLQFFALSLLTVRSEGPDLNNGRPHHLYPFDDVHKGDRIIICGAGTFGQHLFNRLSSNEFCEIVGWVDEWHEHYQKLGLSVNGYSKIGTVEFDSVVVAFIDESISEQVTEDLVVAGVPKSKIIRVSHYEKTDVQALLKEYEIEL